LSRHTQAIGRGDVDKLNLGLTLGDTREFWKKPPKDKINLKNGILDLEKLTLSEHTPDYLFPNQFVIDWDPKAPCPLTDEFLARIMDEDAVTTFYEILGYCLVPNIEYQKALLIYGRGGNGKSTLLEYIQAFLGDTNCSSVSLHTLEGNRFATNDLVG